MKPRRVVAGQVRHHVDAAVAFEIAGVMIRHGIDLFFLKQWLKLDHRHVAELWKSALLIEHIGDPARHAGGKIAPGLAKHDHDATRHVLATVVAGTLDHRDSTGVADSEAFRQFPGNSIRPKSPRKARYCRR